MAKPEKAHASGRAVLQSTAGRANNSGRHGLFRSNPSVAVLLVLVATLPFYGGSYWTRVLTLSCLYAVLAFGLNIVAGFAGLLDMGYVAFYTVGAYTYAFLASPHFNLHWPLVAVAPVGIGAAVAFGLLLGAPSLRLRGDYLAIVTMGFGMIINLLLLNLDRPINITGGSDGLIRLDPPRLFGFTFESSASFFYLFAVVAALALVAVSNLQNSRVGRAWMALRDDEVAAAAMGVNPPRYKVLAFACGAAVAGLAGVLFASWQGAAFPSNFSLNELVNIYVVMVLGGTGNVAGSILGALGISLLGELLRDFALYRMLVYSLLLLLAMRYRPQGILPVRPRRSRTSLPDVAGEGRPGDRPVFGPRTGVAPAGDVILAVEDLSKAFGGVQAVRGVSFELRKGEVLSIIGPNGAGKTTLFNLITGIYRPDSGSVRFREQELVGLSADAVARKGLARTFQNIRVFPQLSVMDNVMVGFHSHLRTNVLEAIVRHPRRRRQELGAERQALDYLLFFGRALAERHDEYVSSLSYADRRRVEIARALATQPEVLLLDEPAAGMNPAEAEEMCRQIHDLRDRGYSVILVEHQMSVVMSISDRIVVMNKGEKLAEGRPEEIRSHPEVIEAYLGRDEARPRPDTPGADAPGAAPAISTGGVGGSGCNTDDIGDGMHPMLELRNVSASYGQIPVLKGISLSVYPGEIVCLLGSNAAGKTTTIKTIIGNLHPRSGEVRFEGRRINGLRTPDIVKRGIAIVPEGRRIFGRLTVEENLEMGGYLCGDKKSLKAGIDYAYERFPILKERRRQKAGTLSGGEQQMLAIARALMTSPRLLCLDEPSMGLSPIMVQEVFGIIRTLNKAGTTIFMVEQNARMALGAAHRGYVLQTGAIVMADDAAALMADEGMQRAYLGEQEGERLPA